MADREKKGTQGDRQQEQGKEKMGKGKQGRPEELGTKKGRGQSNVENPRSDEVDSEEEQQDEVE